MNAEEKRKFNYRRWRWGLMISVSHSASAEPFLLAPWRPTWDIDIKSQSFFKL